LETLDAAGLVSERSSLKSEGSKQWLQIIQLITVDLVGVFLERSTGIHVAGVITHCWQKVTKCLSGAESNLTQIPPVYRYIKSSEG
jgi:hypothetical protein